MKKNDAAESSFSSTRGCDSHNKKNRVVDVVTYMVMDMVVEEVVIIPHKPMTMPILERTRV